VEQKRKQGAAGFEPGRQELKVIRNRGPENPTLRAQSPLRVCAFDFRDRQAGLRRTHVGKSGSAAGGRRAGRVYTRGGLPGDNFVTQQSSELCTYQTIFELFIDMALRWVVTLI
jgi:hypothetical protein